MNDKDSLKHSLENHLEFHPEDTKEFLDICSAALTRFMEAQTKSRNNKAYMGLVGLMALSAIESKRTIKELGVPFMIDAFVYAFPNGWDSIRGESGAVKKAFKNFLEEAEKYKIMESKDWLVNIKQCWDWAGSVFNHPDYQDLKKNLAK